MAETSWEKFVFTTSNSLFSTLNIYIYTYIYIHTNFEYLLKTHIYMCLIQTHIYKNLKIYTSKTRHDISYFSTSYILYFKFFQTIQTLKVRKTRNITKYNSWRNLVEKKMSYVLYIHID